MTKERRRLFWVWCAMRYRCEKPKDPAYKNYGGRGIKVCERWHSFECFEEDMGTRPKGGMLDRINNDGDYEPTNCRWASRQQQNSNRRNCIYVSDENGGQITLKEYCRRKGMPYRPIVKRIKDRGWPIDIAITSPVGQGYRLNNLQRRRIS